MQYCTKQGCSPNGKRIAGGQCPGPPRCCQQLTASGSRPPARSAPALGQKPGRRALATVAYQTDKAPPHAGTAHAGTGHTPEAPSMGMHAAAERKVGVPEGAHLP